MTLRTGWSTKSLQIGSSLMGSLMGALSGLIRRLVSMCSSRCGLLLASAIYHVAVPLRSHDQVLFQANWKV